MYRRLVKKESSTKLKTVRTSSSRKRTCRKLGSMLEISSDLNTTTFPSALGVCEADTELEGAVTGGTDPNGTADGDGEGVAAKHN